MKQPTKQTEKNDKLAQRESGSISTLSVPDYLRKDVNTAAAGLENVEQRDMTLPRLSLCQSMSPSRKRTDPKFIDGLEEGEFFNTITRENYGGAVKVVPLFFFKTRLYMKDIDDGGGILCRSDDNKEGIGDPGGECARCPKSQFGAKGDRPECNQLYNYSVLVVGEGGRVKLESLAVLSLKSTGLKFARDWNALMRLRNTDSFAGIYELKSIEAKSDNYSWFVPTISPAGWVSKEAYEIASACYKMVREFAQRGNLRFDPEELEHAEPGSAG